MRYIQNLNINFIEYHEKLSYFQKIKIKKIYFQYSNYDKNRDRYESVFRIKKILLDTNSKNILCNMIIEYCQKNKINDYLEGEDFFIKHASNSWCIYYARKVIKSRWLKIENKIFSKVKSTFDYVSFFKIPPNPLIIKKISESSLYSYKYCRDVVKDRVIELEDSILKNHQTSFFYFKYILKKNWDNNQNIKNEIEKSILNNFYYTKKYIETYKRKFNKIYEEDFYKVLETDFFMIFNKYKNDQRFNHLKRDLHFKKK
jgi:hypothetical protein